MQSFWDYLRLRSRDSVLAGLQQAIDVVEGDGGTTKDQEAARRFLDRHEPEKSQAGETEGDLSARVTPLETTKALGTSAAIPSISNDGPSENTLAARIAEQMRNDVHEPDAFERRLEQTNPASSQPPPPAPRKRGRPRKNP